MTRLASFLRALADRLDPPKTKRLVLSLELDDSAFREKAIATQIMLTELRRNADAACGAVARAISQRPDRRRDAMGRFQ